MSPLNIFPAIRRQAQQQPYWGTWNNYQQQMRPLPQYGPYFQQQPQRWAPQMAMGFGSGSWDDLDDGFGPFMPQGYARLGFMANARG